MIKENFLSELSYRLSELQQLVNKTNKMPVLILSQYPLDSMMDFRLPNIRESISNIICFIEIGNENLVPDILEQIQGYIDRIILDIDNKRINSRKIIDAVLQYQQKIPILCYSDFDIWGNTAVDFIAYNECGLFDKKVLVCGNSPLSSRIITKLLRYGAQVFLNDEDYIDGVCVCDNNLSISIQSKNIHKISENSNIYDVILGISIFNNTSIGNVYAKSIYDVGLNNFTQEFITTLRDKGASIYRYDNRAGLSSVLLNLLETEYLIKYNMGEVKIGNIDVISGGIMGDDGAIVVDNAYNPQFIVGVANGTGMIKSANLLSEQNIEDMNIIKRLISYGK